MGFPLGAVSMGVEYCHTLVVQDPSWQPRPDTAARVDQVLRQWSLVSVDPEIYDLSETREYEMKPPQERRRLYARPVPVAPPGPGLALVYPDSAGPVIERIFGPSYYPEVSTDERYLYRITLIVGDDFRLHGHWMDLNFAEVVQPPTTNGAAVEPYAYRFPVGISGDAYPTHASTKPPTVNMHIEPAFERHIGWHDYAGFFRAALVLDCNKDLPKFADGKHLLPGRDFVDAISDAFGSPVIEFGRVE
jgi:hypothetical protein